MIYRYCRTFLMIGVVNYPDYQSAATGNGMDEASENGGRLNSLCTIPYIGIIQNR
jgi:hypothetical protein